MKNYTVKPEDAVANVEHAIIGFSDQVPWWGMVKQWKHLYMEHEYDKVEAKAVGQPSQNSMEDRCDEGYN